MELCGIVPHAETKKFRFCFIYNDTAIYIDISIYTNISIYIDTDCYINGQNSKEIQNPEDIKNSEVTERYCTQPCSKSDRKEESTWKTIPIF